MATIFRDLARLLSRTSHPASTAAGDVWWRSDRSQAHASDGGSTPLLLGPTGNIPAVRSGGWYVLPTYGTPSSVTMTQNIGFALALWPGMACTLEKVSVEVTVAVTGNLRTGLYEDSAGVPGDLIQDFGTISSGSTGLKTWSPTPIALRPVLYWLVVAQQGSGSVGMRSHSASDPLVGSDTASVSLASSRNAYYRNSVSGALPSSFGAVDGATSGPAFLVQLTT